MKQKIRPFDILKVKKTKQGLFLVPRFDFDRLFLEKKKRRR